MIRSASKYIASNRLGRLAEVMIGERLTVYVSVTATGAVPNQHGDG